MDFIDAQKLVYPELADTYDTMGNLFTRKLWHQLSVVLESFLAEESNLRPFSQSNNFLELYEQFISKFDSRLNPIRFAQILSMVGKSIADPQSAIVFLSKGLTSRARIGIEASMCIDMDIALMKLKCGNLQEVRGVIEENRERLSTLNSSEPVVFSKFYKTSLEYRKVAGPAEEFYKEAMMYLSYSPLSQLRVDEKFELATDLALASLVGEEIYNFGEIITSPVLYELVGTPNQWLHDLVLAIYKGNIDAFNTIVDSSRDMYFQQPSLISKHDLVKQKVVLLSLVNLVFERPSSDRIVDFATISSRAVIPTDQVEWVLMRAMSIGLIKGFIDEISQTVEITWIQPRILDKEHIEVFAGQLQSWSERVKGLLSSIDAQTPELLN